MDCLLQCTDRCMGMQKVKIYFEKFENVKRQQCNRSKHMCIDVEVINPAALINITIYPGAQNFLKLHVDVVIKNNPSILFSSCNDRNGCQSLELNIRPDVNGHTYELFVN